MSSQFNYPSMLVKQKDGGYLVQFQDFPEAITQGDFYKMFLDAGC